MVLAQVIFHRSAAPHDHEAGVHSQWHSLPPPARGLQLQLTLLLNGVSSASAVLSAQMLMMVLLMSEVVASHPVVRSAVRGLRALPAQPKGGVGKCTLPVRQVRASTTCNVQAGRRPWEASFWLWPTIDRSIARPPNCARARARAGARAGRARRII